MPTNFETFEDDDVIFARHVKQLFPSIQELESGFALYRVASSAPEGYSVDFSSAANSDGHSLDSLTPGQTIIFKANYTNLAGQNLKVLLNNSQSVVHPLYMGNTPIGADVININQIVMVVYNNADPAPNAAPARFQVIGVSSGSGGGIATPVSVANGGTGADNIGQARTNLEVPSNAELAAGLAGKANSSHTHPATNIGSGNVSDTEFGYLDGVTSPIQAQLNSKQSQSGFLDDIASLTLTKGDILVHDGVDIAKLDAGTNGQVLSADSAEATGLKWVAQSGGGGATNLNDLNDVAISGPSPGQVLRRNSTEFVNANLATSDITGLDTALTGKANSSHTHPFSAITGTVPVAQGGTDATTAAQARTNLGTNNAANITTGTLPVARGGTGISSLVANRLLGSGTTANVIQAITIGAGLSLSAGALSASLSGTGVADRIAFWSGTNAITSSSDLTFNDTTNTLAVPVIVAGTAGSGSVSCPGVGSEGEKFGALAGADFRGTSLGYNAKAASESVAIGHSANKDGVSTQSVFIGRDAGKIASGVYQVAVGYGAGAGITTGTGNVCLGCTADVQAGVANSVAVGTYAKSLGDNGVAVGVSSFCSAGSVSIGLEAGKPATQSATSSVFVGTYAGRQTTQLGNVFIGAFSGQGNTTGQNTAVGLYSLSSVNVGNVNCALGAYSLFANQSGNNNSAFGYAAGYFQEGSSNTLLGLYAGRGDTGSSGNENTCVGDKAGYSLAGSRNVFIGFTAGYSETGSDKLYIHNGSTSTPLIHGEFNTFNLGINAKSYGGGQGVMCLANVVAAPTSNPVASGLLYVESGALKFRGSSGTVTTIASA